ncbi:hypothetical protein ABZ819_14860 [Streptomyces venezuelae]|uniref:hypothetical protein n=1 Tax=Streptomyces venezuelae TaxID=54571 RepID=UPI00343EFC70
MPTWEAFSTGRIAVVAAASTRALLDTLGWRGQILYGSVLTARPGRSESLADLAAATGARGYLCGTGDMTHLAPPYAAQGVAVLPFLPPTSGTWASGRRISALWAIATRGPDAVAARLRELVLAQGQGSARTAKRPRSMTWAFFVERVTRIELALSAWEARVIKGQLGV